MAVGDNGKAAALPVGEGAAQIPSGELGDFSQPLRWTLVWSVWTIYGLVMSLQQDVSGLMNGRAIHVWSGFALQLPQAWAWAALTPTIFWLGRRLPVTGAGWLMRVPVHLLISAVIVFFIDLLFALYTPIVAPMYADPRPLLVRAGRLFGWWFAEDSVLYWFVLAVGYARDEAARARARELQRSKLEGQLAMARLAALKMQLHPHFLFNALHTVGALVRTGQSAPAVQVVARLGDLLRGMLDDAMTQEVPLRQELEFVRGYLEVEQIRFADRLAVRWDVDPAVLHARVPHLMLQPLVENALRHGIAPHERGGLVAIAVRRDADVVEVTVTDNGEGLRGSARADATRSVGLVNTRLRLAQLYGAAATLEVRDAPTGGVTASIRLPFHGPATDSGGGVG